MSDSTCLVCGETFVARKSGKPQRYCGKVCYRRAAGERAAAKRQAELVVPSVCKVCGAEFPRNRVGRPSWYCSSTCRRVATAEYNSTYWHANKDTLYPQYRKWVQAHPERQRAYNRKHYLRNGEAWRANNRRWKRENPEAVRAIARERQARMRGAGVYRISAKDLRRLESESCFYCGGEADQVDHLIPVARGGRHAIGNLVAACGTCNRRKATALPAEFLSTC